MKIAITGASGLIGSALQSNLLANGHELVLLSRVKGQTDLGKSYPAGPNRREVTAEQTVQRIQWDPGKGVSDLQQLEGIDAVVHLAGRSIGQARWTEKEKMLLRDSRVLATERLVSQLLSLRRKPSVFFSASAIGIYGECGDQWVDESAPIGTGFLADLARDWEQASRPLQAEGVRVVHGRFGIVLARQGGALAKMLPIFNWGFGGVLGSGQQFMSWIEIQDCCRAIQHLVDSSSITGPVNIVSPNPVSNREFTKTLGEVLRRPTVLPAPKFALRAALGEMADALLLSSCRVRPVRLSELGFAYKLSELTPALTHLLSTG